MSEIAIQVEGLGKRYRIGRREGYLTLRDALVEAAMRPFGWISRNARPVSGDSNDEKYIWALQDVSFDVRRGEVVGIIGCNGAGKSTLLKILARITKPTEGYAEVHGRIGSLLEVGTGFHGELTGRENTYLSGAILGMKKREIDKKFDEIVGFSEIEKFMDTPVKYYSSGMYVRLAFAVAAHLEPEILLVDEVLAVGDAAFRKKCLGRMGNIAKEGRTVLFVSHNLSAVRKLCTYAILIDGGKIEHRGADVNHVVGLYSALTEDKTLGFSNRRRIWSSELVKIVNGGIRKNGSEATSFEYGDPMGVWMDIEAKSPIRIGVELVIRDMFEHPIAFLGSGCLKNINFDLEPGITRAYCDIPSLALAEGRYYIDLIVAMTGQRFLDYLESALRFDVVHCDPNNIGRAYIQGKGSVYIDAHYYVADSSPIQGMGCLN